MAKKIQKDEKLLELLKNAVENVSNGVVISDPNKKDNPIIYVNKAFTEITGYKKEDVLGKNCRFLQGTERDQKELKKLRKALKEKKEVYVVLKNFKKDGTVFWNELHITPVFDENNNLSNFIGIQNDITERKVAQDELVKYKEYLQQTVDQRTKELIETNEQLKAEVGERQKAQEKISLLYNNINDSAKKLEVKLKKVDLDRIPLTKKERKAFVGIVRYPGSTLAKLSKKINLPISTINAVKTRLYKEGYYTKVNLPRFELFTNYLISVVYYDVLINIEKKYSKPELEKIFKKYSNVIYSKQTDNTGFYVLLTKSWSEFKEINDDIAGSLELTKDTFKIFNTVHFPLDKTEFHKLFNYEDYLQKSFGVELVPSKKKKFKERKKKFNEAEKKVFYGLVKYPEYNMHKLSERIEVSQPTISNYNNELRKSGMLRVNNKPIYSKVGVHLLVLRHYHFVSTENRGITTSSNDFFSFTSNSDHISFSIHKDYSSIREDDANPIMNTHKIIGEPIKLIIPIDNIRYQKQDFASALRKILFEQ